MNIDWKDPLPFDHKGRWHKNIVSFMTPGQKVTWPQFIAECVIWNRHRFWKQYKDIRPGLEWYKPIQKQVRDLCQQANTIVNYFPHPDDEPLVVLAFKNTLRNFNITKIGQFRKVRVSSDGKQNITQDEKDFITSVWVELNKLTSQRDTFKLCKIDLEEKKKIEDIKFDTDNSKTSKKISIKELMEREI